MGWGEPHTSGFVDGRKIDGEYEREQGTLFLVGNTSFKVKAMTGYSSSVRVSTLVRRWFWIINARGSGEFCI